MTKRTTNSAAGGWEPPAAESLHPATDLAAASLVFNEVAASKDRRRAD